MSSDAAGPAVSLPSKTPILLAENARQNETAPIAGARLAFAVTIFIGAFLLFLVQPMIGKYILPWFGGGPGVWTTCLLFFQVVLLIGYAYAHFSVRFLSPKMQSIVHLILLVGAVVILQLPPSERWKPASGAEPIRQILFLLTVSIGLPYLVLSSTGPLMQAWFSRVNPGASPYRLFALSNVGSLLALLSYPFGVEPALSRPDQAWYWRAGLIIFVLACGWCAILAWKHRNASAAPLAGIAEGSTLGPTLGNRLMWLALPACASLLLMAVTNKICQDVAVIPFLWIVPLSLYLLSFIICFDSPQWYVRPVFLLLVAACLPVAAFMLYMAEDANIMVQVAVYTLVLFICCMVCHGELSRMRPHPRHLTSYYLMISAGGAIGGAFVAIIAPLLFAGFFELQYGLMLCALLVLIVLFFDRNYVLYRGQPRQAWIGLIALFLVLGMIFYLQAKSFLENSIERTRNFYGVLTVFKYTKPIDTVGVSTAPDDPKLHQLLLKHGGITHGMQFIDPERRKLPTTYYDPESGVGRLMRFMSRQSNRRIGLVGLGTGTLAAYGKEGDYFRFYEINPAVEPLARKYFTFLKDSPAKVEVILGDARLSMEREESQQFDVLVLDAFSGDAVPVHLLTQEAFDIFSKHLKPDGVIAVHISNRHFRLQPIVMGLADYMKMKTAYIISPDTTMTGAFAADWILMTSSAEVLGSEEIKDAASSLGSFERIPPWTDDHANLFQILR